ncbi:MAG: putative Fe2+ transport system protein, subunit B [Promethearchaeota archaeon]|nr:MAG: putative Fe2+ transport system protein, subunit B [Candidatus Lokiarchaeota archaeon]
MRQRHRKGYVQKHNLEDKPLKGSSQANTINIALAGNPNVGKSVIFNQLTGLSQTIGNWPGKTVERKEGQLEFLGFHFNIVDLPGIYSLSTYSLEEIVSREYIVSEEVDVIINVIDATNLERNLFFTFQLLELEVPVILAINQCDILDKRNRSIDFKRMEEIFKLPVIPCVAIHGKGVHQLLEEAIELSVYHHPHQHYLKKGKRMHEHLSHAHRTQELYTKEWTMHLRPKKSFQFPDLSSLLKFGKEVEGKIEYLISEISQFESYFSQFNYPGRFLAIKLLEDDNVVNSFFKKNESTRYLLNIAEDFRKELEEFHGEDIHTIISSEIYNKIHKIIRLVLISEKKEERKKSLSDKLDQITTHPFWGYVILILILVGTYFFTFEIGNLLGGYLEEVYGMWSVEIYGMYGADPLWVKLLWDGVVGGVFGAIGGVLVYVIPFFLIMEILQDSGYLPRAAFLLDKFMHFLGVHGKTIIPMILGFGCNVPACAGCRIMETRREKKISVALTSLIPCSAVLTVVMGLVGRFLGPIYVGLLFLINFVVIIIFGKVLNKTMPGKCTELIMEMHEYRAPNTKVILKQTWNRSKEFIFKAMPIIIILGIVLELLLMFNLLEPINLFLSPITFILGLPLICGIFLIYGIIRKELTLVLLQDLAQSLGMTLPMLLTPLQMFVFSLVTMLYIPCFATIIIIARETNWKYAIKIALLEVGVAIVIGALVYWGGTFLLSLL